jgi:hypothetical protein
MRGGDDNNFKPFQVGWRSAEIEEREFKSAEIEMATGFLKFTASRSEAAAQHVHPGAEHVYVDVGSLQIDQGALGHIGGLQRSVRTLSSVEPKKPSRKRENACEDGHPSVWLQPQDAALGGILLGNSPNLLGTWLYLYDDRRRWTGRRVLGTAVVTCGWLRVIGGYLWAAESGGGY